MKKIILIFVILSTSMFSMDKIKVVLSTGYPPYYYWEQNDPKGLCIDILEEILDEMSIEPVYSQYPWKRSLYLMEKGQSDLILPIFKTKEREKFLYYNDKNIAAYERNSFFHIKNFEIKSFGNFSFLSKYRLGVSTGYSYGEKFDNFEGLEKDYSYSEEDLLKKLIAKRVDIILGNRLAVKNIQKTKFRDIELKEIDYVFESAPSYFAFSKISVSKDLVDKFAEKMEEFVSTERYKEIINKYE